MVLGEVEWEARHKMFLTKAWGYENAPTETYGAIGWHRYFDVAASRFFLDKVDEKEVEQFQCSISAICTMPMFGERNALPATACKPCEKSWLRGNR